MIDFPEGPWIIAALSLAFTILLGVDRALQWRAKKQFVSQEQFENNREIRNQEQVDQDTEIVRAHHKIELLERDVKGLPGYEHVNKLSDGLSQVRMEVAVGNSKLDAIRSELGLIRKDVDKVVDLRRGS